MIEKLHQLWEHAFWADGILYDALRKSEDAAPEALREYAHIIGAEETWLARLERRSPRATIWPETSMAELQTLREETETAYRAYLAGLRDADLAAPAVYTNTAGRTFTHAVADILMHVLLHGQYHRGKVNLLLRQAGRLPAPTDYIAFVRGVPAATEEMTRREPPSS